MGRIEKIKRRLIEESNKRLLNESIILPYPPTRILKDGSKGDDVKKLQSRLKELGYDLGDSGTNGDGIDGSYGSKTKEAVKKVQKLAYPNNYMEWDGQVGKKTVRYLNFAGEGKKRSSDDETNPIPPKKEEGWRVYSDSLTRSPFDSKEKGDRFRMWVNSNLPNTAKKHKLDLPSETSSHKNSYVLNTLNQELKYKNGDKIRVFEYYKLKSPNWDKDTGGGGSGLELSTNMNPRYQNRIKTDKINSKKKVDYIIDKPGTDQCAQFVNNFSNQFDSTGSAWLAHEYDSKIGPTSYSAFKNLPKDKIEKIIELYQKIDNSGEGAKERGSFNNEVRDLVDSLVPAKGTVKNIDMDDVVGIYYYPSDHHQEAFFQSGDKWFTGTEGNKQPGNTIKNGTGWGMNTHLGIVGATKYGKPIVFHNIGGNVISEPADNLRIAWVKKVG
jgi:hypothetical protein